MRRNWNYSKPAGRGEAAFSARFRVGRACRKTLGGLRMGQNASSTHLLEALDAAIDAKITGWPFLAKMWKVRRGMGGVPTQAQLDRINFWLEQAGLPRVSCAVKSDTRNPWVLRARQRQRDAAALDAMLAQPIPKPPGR